MRSNPGLHGHIWLFDRERIELTVPEPARRRPLRMPKPGDRYSGTAEEFLAVQVFDSLEHGETGGSYRKDFQPVPNANGLRYVVGDSLFHVCPGFPLEDLPTARHIAECIKLVSHRIQGLHLDCYAKTALGYWIENGLCYFDVGNIVDDRDQAIGLALQRGEKTIFDLFRGEPIHTRTYRSWSGWVEYNRNRHARTTCVKCQSV